MLSRVADSLYWMSRYLERAEHIARLLNVYLNFMLEQSQETSEKYTQVLLHSLKVPPIGPALPEPYAMTQRLAFDQENKNSLSACVAAARENASQIREGLNAEMWEQLNQLYWQIRSTSIDAIWNDGPHDFFSAVKKSAHLFHGMTDSIMNHGEGWHFIQLGRFIERASATAMLLDNYFVRFADRQALAQEVEHDSYLAWVSLLKSCTAFESYCKVYTVALRPDRIAEFLLLNAEFPRSVRFSADMLETSLHAVAASSDTRKSVRVERLAGRLRATLSFGLIDEIVAGGLHSYLEDVQRQCAQIHTAIYQTYITYTVDSALV